MKDRMKAAPHPDKIPTARIQDAQRIALEYGAGLTVERRKELVIDAQNAAEDLARAEVDMTKATERLARSKEAFRRTLDALSVAAREADDTARALGQRLLSEEPK